MKILTVQHPTLSIEVEAVSIHTADDLVELRASDWHDGQLSLLTFPTAAPIGFVSTDPPKAFGGKVVAVGDTVIKGPGGDVDVIPSAEWWG